MAKLILLLFFLTIFAGCGSETEKTPAEGIEKNLSGFLFVGKSGNNSSLFQYSMGDSSYKKIWEEKGEKIIELNYSDDRGAAFMITAKKFGKRGAFPFIDNMKIYLIDTSSSSVEPIQELGNGLQIFSKWESESSFKVVVNSFNEKNANFVEQQTLVFSTTGKIILDETKTFDLTNEGYPNMPSVQKNLWYENYNLIKEGDKIFISDSDKNLITETDFNLNQIKWTKKYLIFTAVGITPDNETLYSKNPQTSVLVLYSLDQKKILKEWKGSGTKTFFVQGNYLVFDDGFGENSVIKIFDIKNSRIFDTIKIKGGCGLNSIPQIPDYSA